MKRWFLVGLVLFLGTLGSLAEGLRLATWNLENYLLQNRWEHGAFRFNYPKPEAEKAALRRLLLELRPDILLVQEIGSEALLAELQEDLAALGLAYPYAHVAILPDGRSGLGLLAMRPPTELLVLDPRGPGGAHLLRGIQEMVFHDRGQRLRLFHVHLKSRYTTDPADPQSVAFRRRELALLRTVLAQRLSLAGPDDRFLLAGDFNCPFAGELLDDLRRSWHALPVVDAGGAAWTYHYRKTGARDTIDGFWQPVGQAGFHPVGIFPHEEEDPPASDHRLVLIEWRPGT